LFFRLQIDTGKLLSNVLQTNMLKIAFYSLRNIEKKL